MYEVVQGEPHEERLLLQESIMRTKEFKKKQLSDQENDLSHKTVMCPSKEGVTIHIMVLGTCVQRHSIKISICKVHRYQCMCKTVASSYAAVETQRRIFCVVSKYSIGDPTDSLKYGEHQLDDIWRWVFWSQVYGHDSCKTHYIEESKKLA
jgi:hypothetical protein